MSTLLTPKWKKSIIPLVVSRICIWFSPSELEQTITNILRHESSKYSEPFTCLEFRGELFRMYQSYGQMSVYRVGTTSPHFTLLDSLIANRESAKRCTHELTVYLQNGLAICHTTECVEEVFPQFILDYTREFSTYKFAAKDTTNSKFMAFNERHIKFIDSVKYQLIINSLVSDPKHAKPNFQSES